MAQVKNLSDSGRPPRKSLKKVVLLFFTALAIVIIAFFAYILAQTTKVFDSAESGRSFLKTLTGFNENEILKGANEDRVNIIFVGMGGAKHPGGFLTDSIQVVSLRPSDKAIGLLSIPRDLYVPIADHKFSAKINETYSIGEKERKGSGAVLVKKTVGNILDIPIHYYVSVDFPGFEKMIDEIGGVDLLVDKAIYDPYYPDAKMEGYEPFYLKAGKQHLNGKIALKYARSRETTSDFDRSGRQQKLFSAVKEKLFKIGFLANPKKLFDTATIIGDHVRTDLAPTEIKALAEIVNKNSKTVSHILTNDADGPLISDSSSGVYYLYPKDSDFGEIQRIAEKIFFEEKPVEKTKNSKSPSNNLLKSSSGI